MTAPDADLEQVIAKTIDDLYDEETYRSVWNREGEIVTSAPARAVLELVNEQKAQAWDECKREMVKWFEPSYETLMYFPDNPYRGGNRA